MSQQHLLAAVAGQAEFAHDLCLFRLGHRRTVKVGALAVGIALELLETALVVEPLIGKTLSAVHTTHRDNHGTYLVALVFGVSNLAAAPAAVISVLRFPRHSQKCHLRCSIAV